MSPHFFIGAFGDEWIHETRDHWAKKGVLEIKCPFSINNSLVHCMAPKQIAMEYQSFFMEVHKDTIHLKQTHGHYMHVLGEWVPRGVTDVTLSFDRRWPICGENPL